jgi:orotidine-5'-phosphate decarboxylase
MVTFIDNCIQRVKEKRSHLIVGLDPHFERLPKYLTKECDSLEKICNTIFLFNKKIIDAIYDIVPLVKPQIAFYERFGIEGLRAYKNTIKYAKEKGLLVIGDIKRNDIGSTAKAYSDAHIGSVEVLGKKYSEFNVDAITINPYFGSDGIQPFLDDAKEYGKGLFILVKTTNKSSSEFQDIYLSSSEGNIRLFEIVANFVNRWGQSIIGNSGYSSVGAVVGATFPVEIKSIRKLLPKSYFLVPGIGEQGGKIADLVNCFNEDGLGALLSVSRSVIFAYMNMKNFDETQFADAARQEVLRLNKEVNDLIRIV